MIQQELDLLEQKVLTDLFGGYTPDKFILKYGIFKYDFSDKVQKAIHDFESMVKPFMNEQGFIDGPKIKQAINLQYVDIPDRLFRPMEVYSNLQPLLQKLKGYIQL